MRITIDGQEVEVAAGTTVLAAAAELGIAIPTLCHRPGLPPATSCLVCVVRVGGGDRLVPACATRCTEGMRVESDTPAVHAARRQALELLLGDHLGDCEAPCRLSCPAEMDIPRMLREIAAGDFAAAVATVKRDIPLPAILGRICPAPCEKACRRRDLDGAVGICLLKRFVADVDLAAAQPLALSPPPATGKHVAIIGAGPTGLSAADFLRRAGHAVTLLDARPEPGGRLWDETTPEALPRDVLRHEAATLLAAGIDHRPGTQVDAAGLAHWRAHADAVLIAAGATAAQQAAVWGLPVAARGLTADARTFRTPLPGVFAAGLAVRGKAMVIRSVGDGREAAAAIAQFLAGHEVRGLPSPFTTRMGKLDRDELAALAADAAAGGPAPPAGGIAAGFSPAEAQAQARRCMHCDCRAQATCRLRRHAAEYGADPRRLAGTRRRYTREDRHASVLYEAGKCVTCGLCVQIAEAAGEELGLAFVGRGFDVRVAVPWNAPLGDALRKTADACVSACPTAALAERTPPE